MVEIGDIKIIDNELKKLGSKVEKSLLNNGKHSLSNILHLVCNDNKISLSEINNIKGPKFLIDCKCEGSVFRENKNIS